MTQADKPPPGGGLPIGRPEHSRMKRLRSGLVATTIGLVASFLLVELALRAAGFTYELRVVMLQHATNERQVERLAYVVDNDLLWVGRDYARRLRQAGSVGLDVAFLGDSCTEWGRYEVPFAQLLARRGAALNLANLGTAAWSTHQGLAQIRRDILPLAPRVAAISFGWNDHWVSVGLTDSQIQRLAELPWLPTRRTRTGQFALRGTVALTRRKADPPLRVPPEEFRGNLKLMARELRAVGTVPVFITAPTSHQIGHEPSFLAQGWMPDLRRLVPLHQLYASIVREVAAADGVDICDAAAFVERLEPVERKRLFMQDGIHFTLDGSREMAAFLLDCLERRRLLERPET